MTLKSTKKHLKNKKKHKNMFLKLYFKNIKHVFYIYDQTQRVHINRAGALSKFPSPNPGPPSSTSPQTDSISRQRALSFLSVVLHSGGSVV